MSAHVIKIRNLSKFYGKNMGIENVSLDIERGEIFGFIGPNGAGKSTTIRILMNLVFPSGGTATIMDMDVVKDTRKIKQKVGYIPSDAGMYPSMSVIDFLSYCSRFYGLNNNDNRIIELADMFDLDLQRNIAELSLGNRKKVSIIQGLLHSPELLILDEPTTGLDPLMQSLFFDLLRNENRRGMTIFFSSHILGEVQMLCKRVAIIKNGNIIQVEEIDSLRKKQLKKVFIEFENRESVEDFVINGSGNLVKGLGNTLSFIYSGNINELISSLSGIKIKNLMIEEPLLDEIFLHYYKK